MLAVNHRPQMAIFCYNWDTMNHLWSPWRMSYMQSNRNDGCVFCTELTLPDGPDNLILCRGQRAFVILNRFPYTSGHLMTVPYAHVATLEELDAQTRVELMELAVMAMQVLRAVYHPQGFNLGMNIGDAGGAGIAEHIHMHVVPRWIGDTNFMSALGETRVLPELLDETYRRVYSAWCAGPNK
jgi:ATP adenylyltransferase